MKVFSNPSNGFIYSSLLTLALVGIGGAIGANRLITVINQTGRDSIANQRADIARITNDKVILGARYFQPETTNEAGQVTGAFLSPGTILFDRYGSSCEISTTFTCQHVVTALDVAAINEKLADRLKDANNPDANEANRPLRDEAAPIEQATEQQQSPLFAP
jgi:hypothetical protein